MDDFVKIITVLATIIANRRAAGFPVIKESLALIQFVANPRSFTSEEWVEHNKAQDDSRTLRRTAVPRES